MPREMKMCTKCSFLFLYYTCCFFMESLKHEEIVENVTVGVRWGSVFLCILLERVQEFERKGIKCCLFESN